MMKQNGSTKALVIKIIPKTKDIFLYKLSSSFANRKGLVRLLVSAMLLLASFLCWGRLKGFVSVILFLLSLLNPVVTPIWHYFASAKLASTLPVNLFSFCGTRISVNDGKKRLELEWSELYKIIYSKKLLLIFIAPQTAFIIPKDQIQTELDDIDALVKENSSLCHTEFRKYM